MTLRKNVAACLYQTWAWIIIFFCAKLLALYKCDTHALT